MKPELCQCLCPWPQNIIWPPSPSCITSTLEQGAHCSFQVGLLITPYQSTPELASCALHPKLALATVPLPQCPLMPPPHTPVSKYSSSPSPQPVPRLEIAFPLSAGDMSSFHCSQPSGDPCANSESTTGEKHSRGHKEGWGIRDYCSSLWEPPSEERND